MVKFNSIFIETYREVKKKHTIAKYTTNFSYDAKIICNTLTDFVNNSCYFSLFKGSIDGKYLNGIHISLVDYSFYDILYKKILTIYLEITNYTTLKKLSYDSSFVRNINGVELNGRNPHYYNKPGFKINFLVDTLRTTIGISYNDSTESDSLTIKYLFQNLFVTESLLQSHTDTILCDSGYEGLNNNYILTEKGFSIYMGYNLRNNKYIESMEASDSEKKEYKGRVVVENSFANIQRTPILINNYEKTIKSYNGLLLLKLSINLCKKINRIIDEKNNEKLKRERDEANIKKKQNRENIIKKKRREKQKREIENKRLAEERRKQAEKIKYELTLKIFRNVKNIDKIINNSYKSYMLHKILYRKKSEMKTYEERRKNEIYMSDVVMQLKIDKNCDILTNFIRDYVQKQAYDVEEYSKFENNIKKEICNDILYNEVYNIKSYKFARKELYMLHIKNDAFSEENIKCIVKDYDWKNKIDIITTKMILKLNKQISASEDNLCTVQ